MKKILSIILFTGATISMWSCKKSFEELNISPNSPSDATTELILTGAQTSSIVFYEGDIVRLSGMWAGSFTGADRQYLGLWQYVTAAGDYDGSWSTGYRGVIGQTKVIEQKAAAINNKLVVGIAQVMRAQASGTAADLWGDVPFTQAGDAASFPKPKYDPQATVYAGVQKLLDDAILNLSSGVGINPGGKDIFYGGSSAKWLKAAYSLKARFYLHTKDYTKAYANALLGIADPAGDMRAKHGNAYGSDFNLYYSFLVYDRDTYMSADEALAPRMLDETNAKYRGDTKTNEKARFFYYYVPGGNYFSTYECNVFGASDFGDLSGYDPTYPTDNGAFTSDESFPLVTFAETKLIESEAAMRLGNFTDALTALNGHRAMITSYLPAGYVSFFGAKYDPYIAADFNAGGLQNPGTLTANDALLKEIIEERYVTLIGQFEQFNDIRRTKNAIGLAPSLGTKIPQRMLYPQSEANTNPNTPVQTLADLFIPTPANL